MVKILLLPLGTHHLNIAINHTLVILGYHATFVFTEMFSVEQLSINEVFLYQGTSPSLSASSKC